MRRLFYTCLAALSTAVVTAAVASASVAAPSFNPSSMLDSLNGLGTVVLAGLLVIFAGVLLVKAPFILYNIAKRAIHKLFGGAKPSAA